MSLSLEITMKSHDRDSSRKVPCAEICLEVILPAAVCIMECRGAKGGGRKTHQEVSAVAQDRGNRAWTRMMWWGWLGNFTATRP